MMQKKAILVLMALFLSGNMMAQLQMNKEQQKLLDDAVKRGDKAFDGGGLDIDQALVAYEQALHLDPGNAEIMMKIGLCHLNGPHRHKALPFLQKAAEFAPTLPRIHYLLGYAYQLAGEWDKAIAEYEQHRAGAMGIPDQVSIYNSTDLRLAECRNGRSIQVRDDVQVTNLGPAINSVRADYGALVNATDDLLMFTSRRAASMGSILNKATNEYYEDIYYSQRIGDGWSEPRNMGSPVNSDGNDATISLVNNGKRLLLYRDSPKRGDIYSSEKEGDQWSEPVRLGPNVNSKYEESSAWITADGQWIYFVSDRPEDNFGGRDIFRCPWDAQANDWGKAQNLGPDVNTRFDEDGVFVTEDGKTIYFSSKGHNSMGGSDIFFSTYDGGRWTKAQNMGKPVNSPDDDLFFVLSKDGTKGYFSSVRPEGRGMDDLYMVTFGPLQDMGQAR